MKLGSLVAFLSLLTVGTPARADETAAPAAPAPETAAPEAAPAATAGAPAAVEAGGDESGDGEAPKRPTKTRRRGGREKEAEGTQAPNRFEADTVIKSQYKLDGQLLEVDPD